MHLFAIKCAFYGEFMPRRYPIPATRIVSPEVDEKKELLGSAFYFRLEEEIRRSRFITSLGHAPDRETARVFVEAIRREFPDATHHCWAYAAGVPGDTAAVGQSDDGEPHGTAGRPMLHQLLHGGVGEVVAVVSRYFGGVKLGTGGLVRAYQGGVGHALAVLPTVEKTVRVELDVTLDYPRSSRLYRLLEEYQASIVQEFFSEVAHFRLDLPDDLVDDFCEALRQATDGTAVITLAPEIVVHP